MEFLVGRSYHFIAGHFFAKQLKSVGGLSSERYHEQKFEKFQRCKNELR